MADAEQKGEGQVAQETAEVSEFSSLLNQNFKPRDDKARESRPVKGVNPLASAA